MAKIFAVIGIAVAGYLVLAGGLAAAIADFASRLFALPF